MVQSVKERLDRIERFLGIGQPAVPPSDREQVFGEDRLKVGTWLESRKRPGETISATVVIIEEFSTTSVTAWGPGDEVRWDKDTLRRTATLCEALASEIRLSMLQALLDGPKTTAQLLQAVSIDRGQLYHHLQDLFVHGLVTQPERGRYAVTIEGHMLYLAVGHLAHINPEAVRPASDLDIGE